MDEPEYTLGTTILGNHPITLDVHERRQHLAIFGKSGTGKTTLMLGMMLTDILAGRGFIFIDPHGDTARSLANSVPKHLTRNVIFFKPADPNYAVSWNPIRPTEPLYRWTTAANIVEILRTIWKDSWGPRLDHIMTQGVNLLLQKPSTTLADLPQVFTDKVFRTSLLDKCDDTKIVRYWKHRYDKLTDKVRDETLSPVDNKIGQFVSNPLLRDVIGHPSTIDIDTIMQRNQTLIVDLSGMGTEPSRILGALIVSAVWQAAQRRESIPIGDRTDFGLYVDEFTRYATPTIDNILSEARKYRLALILASQYLSQAEKDIAQGILGNVGTLIAFRVGSYDSPTLSKELDTKERILLDLPNYQAIIKTMRGTTPSAPTLITTVLPTTSNESLRAIIKNTRANYARRRA